MNRYINGIQNQILSKIEEKSLILTYKNPESTEPQKELAKEKIIKSNLMYVVKLAYKYGHGDHNKIDLLISEGNFGLLEALEKFDPNFGAKFITFATHDIKNRMFLFCAKNGSFSDLKVPVGCLNTVKKIKMLISELESAGKMPPSCKEIQNKFDLTPDKALNLLNLALSDRVKLDETVGHDFFSLTYSEVTEDESVELPDVSLDRKETSKIVQKIISELPDREKVIISARYPMDGSDELTLEEIGQKFNLTRERIRQIEAKILFKLKEQLQEFGVLCQ